MRKCLLIKTDDKRNFLIWKKDLKKVLDFAATFKIDIFEAKPEGKATVLEPKELIKQFCNPNYKADFQVKTFDKVYPASKNTRQIMIGNAKKIQSFIRAQLLKGDPVSLKLLKGKYKSCNVTDACLCNHLASVRRDLVKEGHTVEKIGAGKYVLRA